jgi:hypothetical protein
LDFIRWCSTMFLGNITWSRITLNFTLYFLVIYFRLIYNIKYIFMYRRNLITIYIIFKIFFFPKCFIFLNFNTFLWLFLWNLIFIMTIFIHLKILTFILIIFFFINIMKRWNHNLLLRRFFYKNIVKLIINLLAQFIIRRDYQFIRHKRRPILKIIIFISLFFQGYIAYILIFFIL